MPRFRIPFDATRSPDEDPEVFEAGSALAKAAASLGLEASTREASVETPWGSLHVEARERGELLVEVPRVEISDAPVMLQAACRKLGLEASTVDASGASMRVVDVGVDVLTIPLPDRASLEAAPEEADPSSVPGANARAGVVYAHTQTSPYSRLLARTWGPVDPLTGIVAAAAHLVESGTMRPTYPRTRVVAELVDREGSCEIAVEAEKVGGSPKVTRVLVGGAVEPVEG